MALIFTRSNLVDAGCEAILLQLVDIEGVGTATFEQQWPEAWQLVKGIAARADHRAFEQIALAPPGTGGLRVVMLIDLLDYDFEPELVAAEAGIIRVFLAGCLRLAVGRGIRSLATHVLHAGWQFPMTASCAAMMEVHERMATRWPIDLSICVPCAEEFDSCWRVARLNRWLPVDTDDGLRLVRPSGALHASPQREG